VAVLGAGTAAAAVTGTLPTQASSSGKAHSAFGLATASGANSAGDTTSTSSTSTTTSSTVVTNNAVTTPVSIPSTGPANSNALFGLCTAFLAHHSSATATSPADGSTAFKALINETGGSVSATFAWCTTNLQSLKAAHSASGSNDTATTTGTGSSGDDSADTPDSGAPRTSGAGAGGGGHGSSGGAGNSHSSGH
jgi:hypothetical protein